MVLDFESPVTSEMILDMSNCVTYDGDRFAVARRVSKTFEVPISKVIGFLDTEYKILAVYVEVTLNPDISLRVLSYKYTIYAPYLLNRLKDFHAAILTDIRVQAQILRLKKEFGF